MEADPDFYADTDDDAFLEFDDYLDLLSIVFRPGNYHALAAIASGETTTAYRSELEAADLDDLDMHLTQLANAGVIEGRCRTDEDESYYAVTPLGETLFDAAAAMATDIVENNQREWDERLEDLYTGATDA